MKMADEFSFFVWHVAESGHKWLRSRSIPFFPEQEDCEFLTDENPAGIRFSATRYAPLVLYPGLFKTFADLECAHEPIRKFANRYGMLGGTMELRILVPHPSRDGSKTEGLGESFSSWCGEISAMKSSVTIWEAIKTSDLEGLSKFIQWKEKDWVGINKVDGESEVIAAKNVYPELLSRFEKPLIDPALYWLQRTVNTKLMEHTVTARLLWNEHKNLGIHIVPTSLIGCLWLQFGNAVSGGKEFRACPECHRWFDVSLHASRTDKKFCAPSCKAAAHRKKPEQALRLKSEGLSITEIAKRLDTKTITIKNWLKK
jgi:hypothetical protein